MARQRLERVSIELPDNVSELVSTHLVTILFEAASESVRKNLADRFLLQISLDDRHTQAAVNAAVENAAGIIADRLLDRVNVNADEALLSQAREVVREVAQTEVRQALKSSCAQEAGKLVREITGNIKEMGAIIVEEVKQQVAVAVKQAMNDPNLKARIDNTAAAFVGEIRPEDLPCQ